MNDVLTNPSSVTFYKNDDGTYCVEFVSDTNSNVMKFYSNQRTVTFDKLEVDWGDFITKIKQQLPTD